MKSLRVFALATLLLLPAFASAEDIWARNDGYLKSAINDCSAADRRPGGLPQLHRRCPEPAVRHQ